MGAAPQSDGRGYGYKAAVAGLVPLLAGCQGSLSTLDPAGPSASLVAGLWWAMLIGAGLITAFVLILLAVAWRRPEGKGADERVWTLGLGVGFVMTVLVALVGYGFWVGERILPRDDGAVRVTAEARQWGWTFTQPGPDGALLETRDVLYVPAGVPFDIEITATDVIHSFWVPRLGGKMDAVPGRVNVARLMADAPGEHEGLCAEFCGIGHSVMRFTVVVYEPGAFPDLTVSGGDDE
ncbi:cytochrome c oxidase subunit II [Pseudotabrizicola alkalilacus]|uniref:Cytochrome c oxidase subunit II n=1 Tax=Pseudotabrizicola alkalilacus TaxID=2305252 RepID=A0A411Z318_9RHOB|nr:cytochrome c oxidase subunit II [Pseudotabrizicola alkalilacus]